MKLLPNWRDVLTRAWSARLNALALLFTALEVALPLLDGYVDIPRGIFASLSGITAAAGFYARLVVQRNLPHG
ncbi:DUF7940 domain-containing protein [Mesorhizobium sp. NZP2298]|uniref:DUF7940 domain-containing protein n=1 Tax=Mesorhizobium sp. NZP2298 TaxID=2483403 RepID=UPI0015524E2B|nr:hypothetical protein [Mesorhizobium sp. NZP2298]QKD00041.1 hypothetical protein EB231_34825 [Mesorhizobium sp. NZP2298]